MLSRTGKSLLSVATWSTGKAWRWRPFQVVVNGCYTHTHVRARLHCEAAGNKLCGMLLRPLVDPTVCYAKQSQRPTPDTVSTRPSLKPTTAPRACLSGWPCRGATFTASTGNHPPNSPGCNKPTSSGSLDSSVHGVNALETTTLCRMNRPTAATHASTTPNNNNHSGPAQRARSPAACTLGDCSSLRCRCTLIDYHANRLQTGEPD